MKVINATGITIKNKALQTYLVEVCDIQPIGYEVNPKKHNGKREYEKSFSIFADCQSVKNKIREFDEKVFPCYSPPFKNKLIESGLTPFLIEYGKRTTDNRTGEKKIKTCWYFIKNDTFDRVREKWRANRK